MSCKIMIQLKKAGEETCIKDYYKYEKSAPDVNYKDLITFWCDNIKTNIKTVVAEKDGKEYKIFNLCGQPPQPKQKGVIYNEAEMTDELCELIDCKGSRLTSWIYIECI